MWEDGRDKVDLCWEPKGKILISDGLASAQYYLMSVEYCKHYFCRI